MAKYIRWLSMLVVLVAIVLTSCTSSTETFTDTEFLQVKSINSKTSPPFCVWGWVLNIYGDPVDSATVKLYKYTSGSWTLLDTYVTNGDGYFLEYYTFDLVGIGDTVKFEAIKGSSTGESITYGDASSDSPCVPNDITFSVHDTIYLNKSSDIIIW